MTMWYAPQEEASLQAAEPVAESELTDGLKPGPKKDETPEEYQARIWEAICQAAQG